MMRELAHGRGQCLSSRQKGGEMLTTAENEMVDAWWDRALLRGVNAALTGTHCAHSAA